MVFRKSLKDIGVNEDVSITLPAHVWIGFVSAYNAQGWDCHEADHIVDRILREMLDPVAVKENEAAMQQRIDTAGMVERFLASGGHFPPDIPPNMEDRP